MRLSLRTSSVSLADILSEILPPVEDLQVQLSSRASQNSIYHLNIVIYGKARRGKTELANSRPSTLSPTDSFTRLRAIN
jgi:hypothetical protein